MTKEFEVVIVRACPLMPGLTSVEFQVANRHAGYGQALVGTEGASIISPIDTTVGSVNAFLALHQASIEGAIFKAEIERRAAAETLQLS